MKKMYDRETNPAVLIRVMPVYREQALPVAVFVKYMDTPNFWLQHSKEYRYPGAARNAAKMLEIMHYAWKYIKEEDPENV